MLYDSFLLLLNNVLLVRGKIREEKDNKWKRLLLERLFPVVVFVFVFVIPVTLIVFYFSKVI
jgi:polyferredoxin